MFIGDSLISSKSTKQSTTYHSSVESVSYYSCICCEFIGSNIFSMTVWDHSKPALVYCVNQETLHIAVNPVFHECTKQIEIGSYSVRDKIQQGLIQKLSCCKSTSISKCSQKAPWSWFFIP